MRLGLRLLFGFFVIAGIAAVFILRVFLAEVKPSVREVMEDVLVDSANILAEQAAPDLRAMLPGGNLAGTRFARAVQDYQARPIDARIWGLHKRTLDFRVYVTDVHGRLVYDSGGRAVPGADFSRWRDVMLTLRGEYGARSTRELQGQDGSTVMVVAAPVTAGPGGAVIGVLAVAKPLVTVQQFIDRAERKITIAGAWLLGLSLAVGVLVTAWTVHGVRRLRRYAQQVRAGTHTPVPALPGELGELALAMASMRERLEGRAQVEQAMRALTHELKSPLTAIGGAAELLAEDLPAEDRQRFAGQVGEQVLRLREMVDRLLELSKLETLREPRQVQPLVLAGLVRKHLQTLAPALAQHRLRVQWLEAEETSVPADAEQLRMAVSNLLANAIDFAPAGSVLDLAVAQSGPMLVFSVRDRGAGVPAYALPRLGERFFSTPRPRDGAKGSGLGLAIVRQVALLHGGRVDFEDSGPGLRAMLALPMA